MDEKEQLDKITKQRDEAWAFIASIKKDIMEDEGFGKIIETLFYEPLVKAEENLQTCREALSLALRHPYLGGWVAVEPKILKALEETA